MRHKCAVALGLLLTMLLLAVPAQAAGLEDSLGVSAAEEALPDSVIDAVGELKAADADMNGGVSKLFSFAKAKLGDILREVLRPVAAVIAAVLICSILESVSKNGGFDYINLGACLAVAVITVGDVSSLVSLGSGTLSELSAFSRILLPTLTTAAATAGAFTSAAAKYAATSLFLDVLMSAANSFILPLICAYTATVVAAAAIGDGRLNGAIKLMKWLCRFTMGALVTAFTAYLSITGIVASGADAAATKAAKTVLSTALPVVGKMVSDASESLVAGAGIIRNSVGVFGLIAVLSVCIVPFLRLGVRYVLFKAAAAVGGVVAGERLEKLIDGVGTAYGMILGLVGAQAVFLFFSVLSLIRTVT